MSRFCKTCAHLRRRETKEGYRYYCGWREIAIVPWAEGLLRGGLSVPNSGASIGNRHVEPDFAKLMGADFIAQFGDDDWSEAMDCPTWEDRT